MGTKLIKRIKVDLRGPRQGEEQTDAIINEQLIKLQSAGANILDIHEVNKDSGTVVFIVLYEMDTKSAKKSAG